MCHAPCCAFCVSRTALQREKTWPNEAGESCWIKCAELRKHHAIAHDRRDIPQETISQETIPQETIIREEYPRGQCPTGGSSIGCCFCRYSRLGRAATDYPTPIIDAEGHISATHLPNEEPISTRESKPSTTKQDASPSVGLSLPAENHTRGPCHNHRHWTNATPSGRCSYQAATLTLSTASPRPRSDVCFRGTQ